jgi:hypothetical protein
MAGLAFARKISEEGARMYAEGTFEINLVPQSDADSPAGRMVIDKTYLGDIIGSGIGQMISKRTESGNTSSQGFYEQGVSIAGGSYF